jgi:hypothetical protein
VTAAAVLRGTGAAATPPCSEGIRWHVARKPLMISGKLNNLMETWQANTTDVKGGKFFGRTTNRLIQEINGRNIYCHQDKRTLPYFSPILKGCVKSVVFRVERAGCGVLGNMVVKPFCWKCLKSKIIVVAEARQSAHWKLVVQVL